jgi:hypothetical protein
VSGLHIHDYVMPSFLGFKYLEDHLVVSLMIITTNQGAL